ncbi:MAG: transglutaminase domain-containing protein, partial [Candidatus Limiplasma sp.]|nr:transglutaminase domain-containing protein [Candidatus Limiplasma sp.]
MRKLAFLQKEPLSRLAVALLLCVGVTLPLLLALDLGAYAPGALLAAALLLGVLTVLGTSAKSRRLLWIGLAVALVVQFVLPGMGLLGGALEAFKALALYFSSYTVALPLFGAQVAGLLATLLAVLSYVFAKRGVGFLPAALVVVLVMFGLWSLGKADLLWYVAPALVALLLQMAQAAHERINVLHVLPMAVATVLLALLLLPAGRLTIEPLAKAASDLKQAISDYLFFTEPRNVFTLGTYGFYPMGNGQLGGEAEPTEFPVMTVKTDRKTLLRAVAKDQYNGRSFTDTSSAKRYLYINPRWQAQRVRVFMENLPPEAIRKSSALLDEKAVSVQMQNRAASTVFTPLFVRKLNMAGNMVPYFNDASELFITRDLERDDRYTIFAPVFEGGDAGLEALVNASLKSDDNYQDIYNAYTQLPSHMEQKVFDDAQNIVRGESTPYGKAMAIMRHLQKYYRYTLKPDTPPQNNDFVTYFLYVGKEGYCTYYASAMTVLCRMANLPARYVEGFLAQPGADGLAYVTGKDAHAWTEVYFEGFGWVAFDPTPLQQGNSDSPPQGATEPEPSPSPEPSPEDQPTPTPDPEQQQDQPSPQPSEEPDQPDEQQTPDADPSTPPDFPWVILLVAAALTALGVRITLRMPSHVAGRLPTEKERIFIYGAAVRKLLGYAHREPHNGETPLVYARRIDGVRVFPTPIAPLWRMLALSNYSRLQPGPEQTAKAQEIYSAVFKGSHLLRKLRFLLGAAFDPRFYRALDTPAPHTPPPKLPTIRVPGGGKGSNAGYAAGKPQSRPDAAPPAEGKQPAAPDGPAGKAAAPEPRRPRHKPARKPMPVRRSGSAQLPPTQPADRDPARDAERASAREGSVPRQPNTHADAPLQAQPPRNPAPSKGLDTRPAGNGAPRQLNSHVDASTQLQPPRNPAPSKGLDTRPAGNGEPR